MVTRKKKLVFVLVAFSILIAARESGYVDVHLTKVNYLSESKANLTKRFYEQNGEKKEERIDGSSTTTKSIADEYPFKASYSTNPEANIFSSFETQVKGNLGNEKTVQVNLKELRLGGLYWLPLYKTGTCDYSAWIKTIGDDGRVYQGQLDGEIEFTMLGTSSIAAMKSVVGEKVAKFIVDDAKKAAK